MIFLLLSIIASGGMAITLRLAEQHGCNMKALTTANYVVAALASWALMQDKAILPAAGMRLTLFLGSVNGFLYLATILLYQVNIAKNGTPLTVSFARLGVLVPTLLSLVIFREYPHSLQWVGVALAAAAIVVINYAPSAGKERASHKLWLIVMFCVAGLADMMSKVFEVIANHSQSGLFLFYTFFAALLLSLMRLAGGKERFGVSDCLWGVAVGVLNYASTMFLLQAILRMPAFYAYPVYSAGTIIFVNLVNFVFLREPITKRQYCGMAIIAAALVCLNAA
jgi:multidrug transporter EmrE-like cation transporter